MHDRHLDEDRLTAGVIDAPAIDVFSKGGCIADATGWPIRISPHARKRRVKIDINEATASDFLVTLPLVKHRLAQLGLWKTAKALDEAIHAIGFEVGEMRQKDRVIEKKAASGSASDLHVAGR